MPGSSSFAVTDTRGSMTTHPKLLLGRKSCSRPRLFLQSIMTLQLSPLPKKKTRDGQIVGQRVTGLIQLTNPKSIYIVSITCRLGRYTVLSLTQQLLDILVTCTRPPRPCSTPLVASLGPRSTWTSRAPGRVLHRESYPIIHRLLRSSTRPLFFYRVHPLRHVYPKTNVPAFVGVFLGRFLVLFGSRRLPFVSSRKFRRLLVFHRRQSRLEFCYV